MSLRFTESSLLNLSFNNSTLELRGTLRAGEIVGLQGPSGCGKSTLLRHIAQVGDAPLSFELSEKPVKDYSPEDRRIGLVFQKALLFPHLSVIENLLFPMQHQTPFRSWSRELQTQRAREFLEQMGLEKLADRAPSTLSGGEAMRVAILRTLLSNPRCLLLDEAFTALDKETKAHVKTWLKSKILEHKIPTLLVAHVEEDLSGFADRVIFWPRSNGAQLLQF